MHAPVHILDFVQHCSCMISNIPNNLSITWSFIGIKYMYLQSIQGLWLYIRFTWFIFNYFTSVGGRTFCTESTNVLKSSVLQINFFEKFWMLTILSYHRFYIWRSEKMIKHSKDHSVWCIFNALVLLELKKIKIHYSLFWEITFLLLMQHIKPTF